MKEVKVQIKSTSQFHPNMIGFLRKINEKTNIGMVYNEKGQNPYRIAISLDDIIYIE